MSLEAAEAVPEPGGEASAPWEVLSPGTLRALEASAALADAPPGAAAGACCAVAVAVPAPQPPQPPPQPQPQPPARPAAWLRVTLEARSPFEAAVVGDGAGLAAARAVLRSRLGLAAADWPPGCAPGPPSPPPEELRLPLPRYEAAAGCLQATGLLAPCGLAPPATLAALRSAGRALTPGTPEQKRAEADASAAHALLASRLPPRLAATLLPFQTAGVLAALSRAGRLLLADDMGTGKTLQAVALVAALAHEGPALIVCPASLRSVWADALEAWLPLPPTRLAVICDSRDAHALAAPHLPRAAGGAPAGGGPAAWPPLPPPPPPGEAPTPACVVISFRMLEAVRAKCEAVAWGLLIVDESHALRCSNAPSDCGATEAACSLARATRRVLMLSGTPSLNRPFDLYRQVDALRPGLLGTSKYAFADAYCGRRAAAEAQARARGAAEAGGFGGGGCGTAAPPFFRQRAPFRPPPCGGGERLGELRALLGATVMLRRTRGEVARQLPPLRRAVVLLPPPPPPPAAAACGMLASTNARSAAHSVVSAATAARRRAFSPASTLPLAAISSAAARRRSRDAAAASRLRASRASRPASPPASGEVATPEGGGGGGAGAAAAGACGCGCAASPAPPAARAAAAPAAGPPPKPGAQSDAPGEAAARGGLEGGAGGGSRSARWNASPSQGRPNPQPALGRRTRTRRERVSSRPAARARRPPRAAGRRRVRAWCPAPRSPACPSAGCPAPRTAPSPATRRRRSRQAPGRRTWRRADGGGAREAAAEQGRRLAAVARAREAAAAHA